MINPGDLDTWVVVIEKKRQEMHARLQALQARLNPESPADLRAAVMEQWARYYELVARLEQICQ